MVGVDRAIADVRAAAMIVVTASEHDDGSWLVTLAKSVASEMRTWMTGRGPTMDVALHDALSKMASRRAARRQAPKLHADEIEELLG